jgi:uncharacterized membrane protein
MTALVMVVVIGFTAFASDLGLQRVAARDMQAVADVVALDTARELPTCTTATLQTAANASLARQRPRLGDASPLVVTPGHLDSTGAFVAGAGTAGCNAVRITAATTVDFAFAPVIGTDSGTATRAAVGTRAEAAVCFSAGTKTVVLNSSSSALGPLLDRIIKVNGLDVVGYTGIVNLKNLEIPIVDLATALGVGTPQQLAGLDVSLQTFTVAVASVVRKQGDVASATLLESIGARATSLRAKVGRFLSLDSTGTAAMSATVNALDLVGASVVAANGTNALQVDQLSLTLPLGLVNSNAKLAIIEPPQIACGKTGVAARTAQVRLDLETSVGTTLLSVADISMGVEVGGGTATLTSMQCTASPTVTIAGQTTGARVVGYGGTGSARLTAASLLQPKKDIPIHLKEVVLATGAGSHTFTYPQTAGLPSPAKHTFSSNVDFQVETDNNGLLGGLLSSVTSFLATVLNPLLRGLITPLLGALGIDIGTMDVTVLSRPACAAVRLAG